MEQLQQMKLFFCAGNFAHCWVQKVLKHFIEVRFIGNYGWCKAPELYNVESKTFNYCEIAKRVFCVKKVVEKTADKKHGYFESVHEQVKKEPGHAKLFADTQHGGNNDLPPLGIP